MHHDPEDELLRLALGQVFELHDGTKVRLRLVGPDDREELLLGFEHLSPQSRYQRFFTPLAHLPARLVDRLLDTDDCNHVALGAELFASSGDPQGFLGVARFIRIPEERDCAEIAVAVVDEFQRRGLGALLLRELLGAAAGLGVRRFCAHMLPENHAVRRLLRRMGFQVPIGVKDGKLIFAPSPGSSCA